MDHPGTSDNSDDDFFGSQTDGETSFGDMGKHELRARHHELQTSGFLDAFDESKEELLQEGFEAGFLESFGAGKKIGNLLGRAATVGKLLTAATAAAAGAENKQQQTSSSTVASQTANELVHRFFASEFQANRDPSTVGEDLLRLVEQTQACFGNEKE